MDDGGDGARTTERETIQRVGTVLIATGVFALVVMALAITTIALDAGDADIEWDWVGFVVTVFGVLVSAIQVYVGLLTRRLDHRSRVAALAVGGANAVLFISAVVQAGQFTAPLQLAIAGICGWAFWSPSSQDLLHPPRGGSG